jgi:UDP-N-acetylglucosamine diphosphorylase/glucosamine-1-phosphate N-acetyltransferase
VTALVLYDDAQARRFEPFALTRPISELRAGAELLRRRWAFAFGTAPTGVVGAAHLASFEELDAPPVIGDATLPRDTVIAASRCAVALESVDVDADVWMCGERVAAVRLRRDLPVDRLASGRVGLEALAPTAPRVAQVRGWWLDEVWDFVRTLPEMLADDIPALAAAAGLRPTQGLTTLGAHAVFVEPGATVEPFVLFDVAAGPVLIRRGATIAAFTRLVGPLAVGESSWVAGERVATCSIGEHCRAHGELSSTIFLGHANKAHDGFVGHSYLGRWVNLGASTVTSNLKNTYGPVSLWTPDGVRETGMQFLGTLLGDHAKTAIGTRLTTGSVIGAAANVFGSPMTPKVVAPFSWGTGDDRTTYAFDRFIAVAERVMARRQVALGTGQRGALSAAFEGRWTAE